MTAMAVVDNTAVVDVDGVVGKKKAEAVGKGPYPFLATTERARRQLTKSPKQWRGSYLKEKNERKGR